MTWPFENDTSAITKKLAKKSLQSEKHRNLMVVTFTVICFVRSDIFFIIPRRDLRLL